MKEFSSVLYELNIYNHILKQPHIMLRTIAYAATLAMTHALKLEVETELEVTKYRGISDYTALEKNNDRFNNILSGKDTSSLDDKGKFKDKEFPPDYTSLGNVKKDTAKSASS